MRTSIVLVTGIFPLALLAQNSTDAQARETARIIGIGPGIDRLRSLSGPATDPSTALERITAREEVTANLFAAALDVDTVIAEIQEEQSQIQTLVNSVSARQAHAAGLVTVASAVAGGGIGIVGTAMQFSDRAAYAGDGVSIGSGALATVLSLVGARLQTGGAARLEITRHMLAPLFDRGAVAPDYPPAVWNYLQSAASGGSATRLQLLVARWTSERLLPPETSGRRETAVNRATETLVPKPRLPVNELTNRSAMLTDLRAEVALMKRDLAGLMRSVPPSQSTETK